MEDYTILQSPGTDGVPSSGKMRTLLDDKEFLWDKAIYFPAGLKGFPNHKVSALTNFSGESKGSFIYKQSMTDPELSVIAGPAKMESNSIKAEHVEQALTIHSIDKEGGAVYLMVTLPKT